MRTIFLETEVKQFLESLRPRYKETAEDLYTRLRDVMSPGNANQLRRYVAVDPHGFEETK